MKALATVLCLVVFQSWAQPRKVTASVPVAGQEEVDLDFAFADDIKFETWDKDEVYVEVMVEINDGDDNDIFSLSTKTSGSTVYVAIDEDMWDKIEKKNGKKWKNCSYTTTLNYTVYLPKKLKVRSNTISGDYEFEYFGSEMNLKTISGAIDVTIPERNSMDFKAKTISGEIYSDIEIKYPY
ncbi:hypothetical protein [Ekhidna sp.]